MSKIVINLTLEIKIPDKVLSSCPRAPWACIKYFKILFDNQKFYLYETSN